MTTDPTGELNDPAAGDMGVPPSQPSPAPDVSAPTPTEPTPSSPEPSAPVEPAAPPAFDLNEYAKSRGYDPSMYDNAESLAGSLFQTAEQYHDSRHYIDLGRRAEAMGDRFQQLEQQPAAPQPAPAAPGEEEAGFKWDVPEVPQNASRYCEMDPNTGRFRPIEPTLQRYADEMNRYQDWHQQKGDEIIRDFPNLVKQVVQSHASELAEVFKEQFKLDEITREAAQGVVNEYATEQQVNQEFQALEAELFMIDQNTGQYLRDPATGQVVLSEAGEFYRSKMIEADSFGIADEPSQRRYAAMRLDELKAAQGNGQPQPPQPPASPDQVADQKKRRFLERAAHEPDRGGTQPTSAATSPMLQNPDGDIDSVAEEIAERHGMSLK